jgi:hypothetical protein
MPGRNQTGEGQRNCPARRRCQLRNNVSPTFHFGRLLTVSPEALPKEDEFATFFGWRNAGKPGKI